jgi:hypothetical protein
LTCTQQALYDVRFRDTGRRHRLTVQLDRGKTAMRSGGYARVQPPPPPTPAPVAQAVSAN